MHRGTGGRVSTLAMRAGGPARAPKAQAREGQAERSEALGSYTSNPPTAGHSVADEREIARDDSLRLVWDHRRLLWDLSSLPRVRKCSRVAHQEGGPVVRITEGGDNGRTVGLAGLVRCGSVWSCLGCSRRIAAKRAAKLGELFAAVHAVNGGVSFVTLTARHRRDQRLRMLWDGVQGAYDHLLRSRSWKNAKAVFGVQGVVRAFEVTDGEQFGFHPHLHLAVIHDTPVSQEMAETMAERMFDTYARGLAKHGLSAIEHSGGMHVETVDPGDGDAVARYMSKLGLELVSPHTKTARKLGNLTAFQVFDEFRTTGNMAYLDRWHEYEQASHQRKQLTASRGLYERYGITGGDREDQALVDEDEGGDDTIALPAESWASIRERAEEFLIAARRDGVDGAARWLDARGLAWSWATPAPRRAPARRPPRAPRLGSTGPPGRTR